MFHMVSAILLSSLFLATSGNINKKVEIRIREHYDFMMRFLILLTVACMAYGDDPKRCCIGNKYTGEMLQFGARKPAVGDAQVVDNTYIIDYDYGAKKVRLMGNARDANTGMYYNLTVLEDFNAGKIYSLVDGNCMVQQVPTDSMTPPCIPDSLMFEGNFTLGGGSSSLSVQSWSGMMGALNMRITVTDDCYPVTMYELGTDRDNSTGVLYSFGLANIKKDMLSEADPFQVPDACKTSPSTVG